MYLPPMRLEMPSFCSNIPLSSQVNFTNMKLETFHSMGHATSIDAFILQWNNG